MTSIIIADTHQIIRQGLKMILKLESDFKIIAEVQNETEVLHEIQKSDCDILLLDMDMPGKSGIELINDVKRVKPELPVLALSIHPEDLHTLRILKAGASGYVCKDTATDYLEKAIRKIGTHGRYISEALTEQLAFNYLPPKFTKPLHEQLSTRELETMRMLVSGKRVKDIAEELELSISTVFTYRARIFEKLEIKTNVELLHYAIENDLIELKSALA
jgi:two-component system, NarL family, invasion response regulator UvrY